MLFALLQLSVAAQQETLKGGELYASNFLVNNTTRDFLYYMPKNYNDDTVFPLLILLHDENENAKTAYKNYGVFLQAKADSFNCILVFADARQGRWQTAAKTAAAEKDSANDIGFLVILADYFVQRYHANAANIYMLGAGNGGEMAVRFSCIVPSKVNAVAPFTRQAANPNCNHQSKVAYMNTTPFITEQKKLSTAALNAAWNFFMEHLAK